MSAKKQRPSVVPDLEAMTVKAAAPEPARQEVRPEPATPAGSFRTSVWMNRNVHDVLRDIAHAERKPIAELIREGLDHVLSTRKYPSIAELEAKNR